jgi:hypothetical protein
LPQQRAVLDRALPASAIVRRRNPHLVESARVRIRS